MRGIPLAQEGNIMTGFDFMTKRTKDPDLLDLPPEWSHPIPADSVTLLSPLEVVIEADESARGNLVRRFGIVALHALCARLTLTREGATVHVSGDFTARVVQTCVITLEPLEILVQDTIQAWFADPKVAIPLAKARRDRLAERTGHEYRMLEEVDDPEPLGPNGTIDLGEVTAQHLCLALPLYPKMQDTVDCTQSEKPAFKMVNPFARLAKWREEEQQKK